MYDLLFLYCNVDDKALLGNDPVKQQWKRSDRCYVMTQYIRFNNEGKDVFSVVGAVVTAEKSVSLVRASMKNAVN
jgi:hypothetical protein